MVELAGRPLLEWVLIWLRKNGIKRVVVGVAHMSEKIIEYFKDGKSLGLNIEYSRHTVEGGTAEGFKLAIERYVPEHTFLALNGDELTDVDLAQLVRFHKQARGIATISVAPLKSPFGVVETLDDDIVKPIIESLKVSIGIYAFEQQILDYLPKRGDVETTAFPVLAAERKLKAYKHTGFWTTVNTLKDLSEAEKQISKVGF
jgi:NDP-sugar pyrophosphorylase family protein